MRFSIISPVAGLQRFSRLSRTHLILAHVQNPLYWEFYRNLSVDESQMIILDNSAYEGAMDMDLAKDRLSILIPTVFVLPDMIGSPSRLTYQAAHEFLKKWRHELPCDFMYVPQFDGTPDDYMQMKRYIVSMVEDFGIKWFGLPRWHAEQGYSRSELCIWIKRLRSNWVEDEPYVHALGMCAGSLKELKELDEAQCDSIDSSAPVWRGWNGFDLEAREAWNKNGTDCDFNVSPNSLTAENTELILRNLRKVGVKC